MLVYFFLYETKSLSLENVDAMYSDPMVTARKSKTWIPAGYIDRKTRDASFWQRRSSVDRVEVSRQDGEGSFSSKETRVP